MKYSLPALLLAFSSPTSADITLYGPGGPHVALKAAAEAYHSRNGIAVNVHFGPQATWNDKARRNADILFGASEQSALAIVRDHQDRFDERRITPLYLRESILLVKKGNPKGIHGVEDLTREGIGIIVNDGGGTSNTSGTGVWEDIAGRKGNIETVAGIRRNIILFAPNSGSAMKAFKTDPAADVWLTWSDWAASNPDAGEVVHPAPDYAIWRDMNIVVRNDASLEVRDFSAWLSTGEAADIFRQYGWVRQAPKNQTATGYTIQPEQDRTSAM